MATETIAKFQDPKYGWVVADPTQSTGYTGAQQAMDLYQQMYNKPIYQAPAGTRSDLGSDKDLMEWYFAATNPDVLSDPASKAYLDYAAQALAMAPTDKIRVPSTQPKSWVEQQLGIPMGQRRAPTMNFDLFGELPGTQASLLDQRKVDVPKNRNIAFNLPAMNPQTRQALRQNRALAAAAEQDRARIPEGMTTLQQLFSQYGQDPMMNAIQNVTGASYDNRRLYFDPRYHNPVGIEQLIPGKNLPSVMNRPLSPLAGINYTENGKTHTMGRGAIDAFRDYDTAQKMEGTVGAMTLAKANPLFYEDPYLTQYYEGPNASLVSYEGSPWEAIAKTNLSKTKGGEDLADDVFQYYLQQSAAPLTGTLGTAVNPYGVAPITYGEGQSGFFTPYQYAIHGIPSSADKVTNISSLGPEYWDQYGQIAKIGDQYGFVTQANPFAGLTDGGNLALDPEVVKLKYKYDTGGGGLFGGGGLGSLLSIGMGLIPGVGPIVGTLLGLPGKIGALTGGGSGSFDAPPKMDNWTVVPPQWRPDGATTTSGGLAQATGTGAGAGSTGGGTSGGGAGTGGGGLPSNTGTGSGPWVPPIGHPMRPAYEDAIARGRAWNVWQPQ